MTDKQQSCVAVVDFLADVSELMTPEVIAHFKNIGEEYALSVLVQSFNIVHDRIRIARAAVGRPN